MSRWADAAVGERTRGTVLATGMVIVATLCFFAGLILDTVTRGRREVRRLAYLAHAVPTFAVRKATDDR